MVHSGVNLTYAPHRTEATPTGGSSSERPTNETTLDRSGLSTAHALSHARTALFLQDRASSQLVRSTGSKPFISC